MAPEPVEVMRLAEVLQRLDVVHGRSIWVRGVLSLQFEGNELIEKLPSDFPTPLASLNGRQVVVRGTVDRDDTGHWGAGPRRWRSIGSSGPSSAAHHA